MESSLQIRKFEELPSALEFKSIESTNIPAVFSGCVSDWEAVLKWNPLNGGLDYLRERVGSCVVEAMLSRSAPVFYGDLRSHERVPLPFSAFIGFCKQHMQNDEDGRGDSFELGRHENVAPSISGCLSYDDALQQIYLAQVSIMNTVNEDKFQLETLRKDIYTPIFLEEKAIVSINLWMNSAQARSSTHYDPHHNLLCLVAGRKQVLLWPPSASPMLYPMPIYGEASNHSSLSLENPDLSVNPRAECLMEYSQKVTLHAGDALFIPEGWFHQVDSDDLTIAVNFWWSSSIMSSILEHMDAYYLRIILKRLTDREMNEALHKASSVQMGKIKRHTCQLLSDGEVDHSGKLNQMQEEIEELKGKEPEQRSMLHEVAKADNSTGEFYEMSDQKVLNGKQPEHRTMLQKVGEADSSTGEFAQLCVRDDLKGKEPEHRTTLHELEPLAIQALHELVSFVHDSINISDHGEVVPSAAPIDPANKVDVYYKKRVATNAFSLDDDPAAKILWMLDPTTLQNVFLALAHNFPRTLEALILHLLSPVAAEVLTRKFDELDQQITEEDRNKFYQVFYSAFDDQFAAMDAILNGKESFARKAFNNVFDKFLGVTGT